MRRYAYIGPESVRTAVRSETKRVLVSTHADVLKWIQETGQKVGPDGTTTATFVIDLPGQLWIADRHSEHVACARGQEVLSAGEMTFLVDRQDVEVAEVTNQSTGYCPEPESWTVVKAAFERSKIAHPDGFTSEFIFRRCEQCGSCNIVKDGWFECGVCSAQLSPAWNFGMPSAEPSEDS